jgi:VIT1/CCC1 family predicted Fe2+/Mn2+ transporter
MEKTEFEKIKMKEKIINSKDHFTSGGIVRDIIIGMSDGLTVPFALAAGLSGAVSQTSIIVIAGFAEIAAGCISMGLGGYLAAQHEAEHYYSEQEKELNHVAVTPQEEEQEIVEIFSGYGLDKEQIKPILDNLKSNPKKWVQFMLRNELNLDEPDKTRARNSGITIALSYLVAGLIPLAPYIFIKNSSEALIVSAIVTLIALAIFGFVKAKLICNNPWQSAWRTVLIGGVAAAVAYAIAKLIAM